MVQSLWSDREADEFRRRYAEKWGEDLALRVYTSRLIGRDPTLVLHGGGNTSVKTTQPDLLGEPLQVLCVKGSGSDLALVEPEGLPAVELQPLLRLRRLQALSDEEMVNQVRIRLLNASAPTPSVEALLHAFVPEKFVDHTHANAILCLTNQPDGAALIREALGPKVALLPWIMPGFPLAKAVADAHAREPGLEGIVLLMHGIFTFGPDARTSYERMIALVDRAERFARQRARGAHPAPAAVAAGPGPAAAHILPVVRGALAQAKGGGLYARMVCDLRRAQDLVAFTHDPACRRVLALGPLTPDHVIRTKGPYLALTPEVAADPERCRAAVGEYVASYTAYFAANSPRMRPPPQMLDPLPRVVVVEGLGVLAFGGDAKAAAIAGDIAEHTLRTKALGERIGSYVELPPHELFAMEYWSLEQAKLGKQKPPLLHGQIALVTGAGGAIGHGIAEALLAAGAQVCVTDVAEEALTKAAGLLRDRFGKACVHAVVADVTDEARVAALLAACTERFGGIDIVVPNAGIAHVSKIVEMDAARFRKVLEVNLTGTMLVLKHAARVFGLQQTGGAVIVQASKNVFDPGAAFGAYSASKAGAHQLAKVAALELAPLGVRVNMVNADAVFGSEVPSGLWAEVGPERMKARGLDPEGLRAFYRDRSLLKVEVTPRHVGEAVVFLASGLTPTTGATLPVDAGVPGAFPR